MFFHSKPSFRSCLSAVALCAISALALPLHAAPRLQTEQAPGFFRQAVGEAVVTALYDGQVVLPPKLLKGLSPQAIQTLLARMFVQSEPGVQTAVNAFLVHTGDHLVLVDAGAAKCFGPSLGSVVDNLRKAGYQPEDVDTVLLTHMHPDHICGIAGAHGEAVFPNATVWGHAPEAGFWLNTSAAEAAPEAQRPVFRMARDAVAAYQAAGRFKTFEAGQQIVAGFSVVPTPGHTPGHVSYLLSSKSQRLLIWGDVLHSHAVKFRHPEVAIEFDSDAAQAVRSRRMILAESASQAWWVAGAHLPFPGIGHVRKEAGPKGERKGARPEGEYAWIPAEFGPLPAAAGQ